MLFYKKTMVILQKLISFFGGSDILIKNTLRSHLFDFYHRIYDADQSYHTNGIGLYVILYCKKGAIQVDVNGTSLSIPEGDFCFLPSGSSDITYHSFCRPEHEEFSFGFRSFPNVNNYDYRAQVVKGTPLLQQYVSEIAPESESISTVTWKFYRFLTIFQQALVHENPKHYDAIRNAIDYMRTHDRYDIPQLAKNCGMSETGFYVAFRQITGTTPIKMKQRLQTMKAEILMHSTDLSIEEIAEQVGYKDLQFFREIFKKRYKGKTPRSLRNERKELE